MYTLPNSQEADLTKFNEVDARMQDTSPNALDVLVTDPSKNKCSRHRTRGGSMFNYVLLQVCHPVAPASLGISVVVELAATIFDKAVSGVGGDNIWYVMDCAIPILITNMDTRPYPCLHRNADSDNHHGLVGSMDCSIIMGARALCQARL